MTAHTYSFLDVQGTITGPGGVAIFGGQGGAAKEGITIEPSEDIGTLTIGAGGEGMHSLHAGRPAKAMIRLLKTSPINAILQAMYNLQVSSGSLYGNNVIVVSDTSRGDVITCLNSAFSRFPTITYAEDGNMNEWSFNVAQVSWLLGTGQLA
jgi:hypothetical protein